VPNQPRAVLSEPVGEPLTLDFALTFHARSLGAKKIYASAYDVGRLHSNWRQLGTWIVPGANQPPAPVSVTPSSGSGLIQAFRFQFSDPNGAGDWWSLTCRCTMS